MKTRARHERETLAQLGKMAQMSRETFRKFETVENTAPKFIKEIMGKGNKISINKAYQITKTIQKVPEDEREELAYLLVVRYFEERDSGVFREKRIAKKLTDIITMAKRNEKIITVEAVEVYLKYNINQFVVSDALDTISEEMELFDKLREIFISKL